VTLADPEFRHGPACAASLGARFRVWAPRAERVDLRLTAPHPEALVAMNPVADGYWEVAVGDARPGARYMFRIDDRIERPDPASRLQPNGVHSPSELLDTAFSWTDATWRGLALDSAVFYELHVGTFTPQGTFDAIIPHLARLRDLGITFLELMPIAQFPGDRNWGYDGVYPFAPQFSYGGPAGLQRLVDACHRHGLAVVLDVVYNHLGPEGNYLAEFGPYFTNAYKTPWGSAINFDGPDSDQVRRYFIENALYWIRDFHIDALRLDAVHGIFDHSARPFLSQLADAVRDQSALLNRPVCLIAESDLNDPRLIRRKEAGGFGLDAQWADEFHHSLRVLLTGDRSGYFADYGEVRQLAKSFVEGYVHTGEYSKFRRRSFGAPATDVPARSFVVYSQNHDQVGNRMLGERLASLVPFESLKLAAAAVILSPHVPLLFMGEEYAEPAPFLYFVSHSDPGLVEAVRQGRHEEFAHLAWPGEPPDPHAPETLARSRLGGDHDHREPHATLFAFYRELLRHRRELPALAGTGRDHIQADSHEDLRTLVVRRWHDNCQAILALCFSNVGVRVSAIAPPGRWAKLLDSADPRWRGPGSPLPAIVPSAGTMELDLPPHSATLLVRQA
jgi:maltooligosyltrehalose trehalohydrolase